MINGGQTSLLDRLHTFFIRKARAEDRGLYMETLQSSPDTIPNNQDPDKFGINGIRDLGNNLSYIYMMKKIRRNGGITFDGLAQDMQIGFHTAPGFSFKLKRSQVEGIHFEHEVHFGPGEKDEDVFEYQNSFVLNFNTRFGEWAMVTMNHPSHVMTRFILNSKKIVGMLSLAASSTPQGIVDVTESSFTYNTEKTNTSLQIHQNELSGRNQQTFELSHFRSITPQFNLGFARTIIASAQGFDLGWALGWRYDYGFNKFHQHRQEINMTALTHPDFDSFWTQDVINKSLPGLLSLFFPHDTFSGIIRESNIQLFHSQSIIPGLDLKTSFKITSNPTPMQKIELEPEYTIGYSYSPSASALVETSITNFTRLAIRGISTVLGNEYMTVSFNSLLDFRKNEYKIGVSTEINL